MTAATPALPSPRLYSTCGERKHTCVNRLSETLFSMFHVNFRSFRRIKACICGEVNGFTCGAQALSELNLLTGLCIFGYTFFSPEFVVFVHIFLTHGLCVCLWIMRIRFKSSPQIEHANATTMCRPPRTNGSRKKSHLLSANIQ